MTVSRFVASFRRHFPDCAGREVLVALSGGSDSVALLHLLLASAQELSCEVVAAHVHHHVRGEGADGDAAFCTALCAGLGVPFAVAHLDPTPPRGDSPEAWWRIQRYRLLEEARVQLGCAVVATAHTRDDQAETVLLKLLRGAGPRGVAGIRRRHGTVIRPLLEFGREELRDWLREHDASWREDDSNADRRRPRGKVRHDLLPSLLRAFPGADRHLADFAESLAEDDEVLGRLLAERAPWPQVGAPVALAEVAALPTALRRRWVLELAARLPLGEPPSRRQLAEIESMVGTGRPGAVDLGQHWVLRRSGIALRLSPPPCPPFAPLACAVPSVTALPGGFVAHLGPEPERRSRHRAVLSPLVKEASLQWRSVRPGETFGGSSGASIKTRLAARGVPAEWRRAWPVLEAGGTMVWVPGVGVARGWEGDGVGIAAGLEEPWLRHERSSRAT